MDFVRSVLANIRGQPPTAPEATPNDEAVPSLDQVLAAGTPSLVEEGVYPPATPASADDDDDEAEDDELDDDDDDADDEDRPAALAVGARVTRSASRAAEKERETALVKLACEAVVDVDVRDRVDRILGVIASCRDDHGRPAAERDFRLSGPFVCVGCGACCRTWFVCECPAGTRRRRKPPPAVPAAISAAAPRKVVTGGRVPQNDERTAVATFHGKTLGLVLANRDGEHVRVKQIKDAAAEARSLGINVGDIVLAIAGEPVPKGATIADVAKKIATADRPLQLTLLKMKGRARTGGKAPKTSLLTGLPPARASPPAPPVAPPLALDAQPLQYGGTIQEAPVAAFGADAVYAYLDAHLEATLRANLRVKTTREHRAQVALARAGPVAPAAASLLARDAQSPQLQRDLGVVADEFPRFLRPGPGRPYVPSEGYAFYAEPDGHAAGDYPEPHAVVEFLDGERAKRDRLAASPAAQPGELWGVALLHGDVGAWAALRSCSTGLRAACDACAQDVFAAAARHRFPAMAALLAASGRRADHVAVYRRLHEADARSRPPRALRPAVTWDDFAFTVECFKGADCVCSTTASFPRAGRQQTFGTSLVTPPVPRPDRDDALAFDDDGDFDDALDDMTVRVFCLDRRSGDAALLYSSGCVEDVDDGIIFYELQPVPVRTIIRGFAPFEGEPSDSPSVQVMYDTTARVFSIMFLTLGYDMDDMAPNEVLLLLQLFLDFNAPVVPPPPAAAEAAEAAAPPVAMVDVLAPLPAGYL